MKRYGMTIPLDGVPLLEQRAWIEELDGLGYTDLWSSEGIGLDGLTPLVLASVWAPNVRLGCAILPVYTRGPALLAMSVAALCQAAPGRFVVGLGTSSNVIVENWNDIPFQKPYQRARDVAKFLRRALAGERVSDEYRRVEEDAVAGEPPVAVAGAADTPHPGAPFLHVREVEPGLLQRRALPGAGRPQRADGYPLPWDKFSSSHSTPPAVAAVRTRSTAEALGYPERDLPRLLQSRSEDDQSCAE